jgi:peroxiredoxin
MNRWILNALLVIALIIAAGAGLYLGLGMHERLEPVEFRYEESTPNALLAVGDDFPDVPVMGDDSTLHATADLLQDGGVVIFMELGCPPCSVMSLNWTAALASWDDPPPVFGIAYASQDRIARYKEKLGITFPIYADTGAVYEHAYQVIDFPFQLVIDTAGLIRSTAYDAHQIIDTAAVSALVQSDSSHAETTP